MVKPSTVHVDVLPLGVEQFPACAPDASTATTSNRSILLPFVDAGGVHEISTAPAIACATTAVGGSGGPNAVNELVGAEDSESPMAFVATTVTVVGWPLVRLVKVHVN